MTTVFRPRSDVAVGFSGTPLARARCAMIPFRLRRKFRFCSCNHQFTGRADGRIRGNQPRLIRRIIFTTHYLSIFLLLTHFASVPASHSLVKRCFRIRPFSALGGTGKSFEPTLTSCCPSCICEHSRHKTSILAADFLPLSQRYFSCIRRGKTPQFYLFTVSPLCMRL